MSPLLPAAAVVALTPATVLAASGTSPYVVISVAILGPIAPVVVGFWLTRKKMNQNTQKVEEIHLLVDGRLDAALATLQEVLRVNVELKDRLGDDVHQSERDSAEGLHDLALSEMQVEKIHAEANDLPYADGPDTKT